MPFEREPGVHFSPQARAGIEFQAAASQRGAFLHAQKTKAGTLNCLTAQCGEIEPNTIVADAQVQMAIAAAQVDSHCVRPSVAHHIGQGFLRHPEAFGFDHQVETAFKTGCFELRL